MVFATLHVCYNIMAQSQFSPIVINTNGVIYTITPSFQNENLNDSLSFFHILIENKSKDVIYVPRMKRSIQIKNRLIINCGYFNHAFSNGAVFMELDRIKIGESFEKTINARNINFNDISHILLYIDFLISKQRKKLIMSIPSAKYEKRATYIFALQIPHCK